MFVIVKETSAVMTNAKRGPSYFRERTVGRTGRVEIPPLANASDDSVQRQLQRWEAPVLSDEEIEVYAKIFMMRPGHELMPFFLWIDTARTLSRWRHAADPQLS